MSGTQNSKRFSINPIEVVIFSVVTLIFFNSAYNLVYDQRIIPENTFAQNSEEGRTPANLTQATNPAPMNLGIQCFRNSEYRLKTDKIRLLGPLCGFENNKNLKLTKTEIINTNNKFTATIFTEENSRKFQTDFIPLASGTNLIKIEFSYDHGAPYTQEIKILRD